MSSRPPEFPRKTVQTAGLAVALTCWLAHGAVESAAYGRTTGNLAAIPKREYAMVLGCPKYDSWTGLPSGYYWNRITAAAALFKAGKCEKIIVSSDVDAPGMLSDVRAAGVPDSALLCDPRGVRTLDSMVRARTIFGVGHGIVVSQRYHNERSIFLARADGTDWIGYDAGEATGHAWWRAHWREVLARVKAWMDVHLGAAKPVSEKPVKAR